jgi:hypothetical protein
MKFKILESNDSDYDSTDKNFYYSWDWAMLKRKVAKNPTNMTFNPLEVEFQNLYRYWKIERRDTIIQRVLLLIILMLVCVLIFSLMQEVMNVT